jgi:hypothetical protein
MTQHLPKRARNAPDQALWGKLRLRKVRGGDGCAQHPEGYGGLPAHRRIPVVAATNTGGIVRFEHNGP